MIEVFKTNVEDPNEAIWLINHITKVFPDYSANFDLEDCDRILRVKSSKDAVNTASILNLLNIAGFTAEVLEDDIAMDFTIITA